MTTIANQDTKGEMLNTLKDAASGQRAICLLIAKEEVAPSHFRCTFLHKVIAETARAGHFVHILPCSSATFDPLLRRAFSIVSTAHDTFDVLFKVTGRGTASMALWSVGEKVDLLGPLGQTFEPLGQNSLLVGGGVGTPPMAMLASQAKTGAGQKIVALIGARTGSEVLCARDFERHGVPMKIATDDGSAGHHGLVTDLLKEELYRLKEQEERPVIYACGPLPMLRSVARICMDAQIACQVSLEENMPCGIGVCNGCVIPVVGQSEDYSSYRRICVDGPVAWAHEVDWAGWTEGERP